MKLYILSPGTDLPQILADKLLSSTSDFSSTRIVFPEKRPGYYLRKIIAGRLGKGYSPPTIQSIEEFIDSLYLETGQRDDRPAAPIDAVSILYQLHCSHPEPLGGQAFLSLDEFFPLGLKLYQDLEELKSGLAKKESFLMIDSLAGHNLPEQTKHRLQKVSFFYENFYRQLEAEKLSTPASRLLRVLEVLKPEFLENHDRVILAGFFLLSAGEALLVKKILEAQNSSLYLLEGPGLEELARKLDLDLREAERIVPETGDTCIEPELHFYLSPDSHGQLFALNHLLADKLDKPGQLTEKQVIVLPALETLIPLHQQTLSSLPEEAYNISLGYPLTRTPLYNFFDCLFNLIQSADEQNRLYAPHYLDFVLHPYTKNIYFPEPYGSAELTRILFHSIQEVLNNKRGTLFWSLEEIASDPDLRIKLEEYARTTAAPEPPEFILHLQTVHRQTIEPFFHIESIGDFATKLIALLNFLVERSTARLHLFFEPYAGAFFEQFENLKNCLLSSSRFENRNSYFNLFRQIMASARVSFPGTPLHGLQVLGFWETRGLKFDEVYILDLNEDVIPGTGKVDSLLPHLVRQALNLPTYQDREKSYRYYLKQLLGGARVAHLFFVENSEKEKSRFVEELLWEKQKKENRPEISDYIKSVSYRLALQLPEIKPVKKTAKIMEFLSGLEITATALDTYLHCPLEFFYARVLKLSEKEELSEALERADIGTLVHHILNRYFQAYLHRPLPEELDHDRLVQITDEVFRQKFADPDSGAFFLMKQQITEHLLEFLRNYQEPAVRNLKRAGLDLKIIRLESSFSFTYPVNDKTFRLKGKIDRIEKRGERWCVLDYKTSSSSKYQAINFKKLDPESRESWSEAIGSLQLPFYQLLAAAEFSLEPWEIYPALLVLGKNTLGPEIEYSPFAEKRKTRDESAGGHYPVFPLSEKPEDRELLREKFILVKGIIERLLLEIADPDRPFTPEGRESGRCEKCAFRHFCGQ